MDLSIVIVNWKVKDLLKKCLSSVYAETKGIDFEVLVVDNDSRDGSVEMVLKDFPQATMIANTRNVGFAAGNNPAIARASGDFVVLLNPDTEIKDNALAKMVAFMRRTPSAGICGPRLLNADGTLQHSVRRFPTFASQALITLKLHHVAPQAKSLQRYFAEDFDYSKAQQVDQVMGAAFMIRRSVLEAIGLLDERFFIWFEEVDFCKRAADAGFQVWYTPEASIIHRGGESFGQVFGPTKQRMFNDSMRKYFAKHHGLPAAIGLAILHPFSMALAWSVSRRQTPEAGTKTSIYRQSLIFFIFLEVISFFGWLYPVFSTGTFLILIALALAMAMISLDLAVLLLFAELFVGSQGGYLVSYGGGGGGPGHGIDISLRIGLFLVVFSIWAASSLTALFSKDAARRERDLGWFRLMKKSGLLWPYLSLLAVFGLSCLLGLMHGNDKANIFFDANGYAFYALFPAVIGAVAGQNFRKMLPGVLFAGVTAAVLKALFVFFAFSHRMFFVAPYIYTWIRDTRVGEITKMVGDFYRVFFQSHLYALAVFFILFLLGVYAADWKSRRTRLLIAMGIWALTGVVMGFSRSFWFGAAAAFGGMLVLFVWARASAAVWRRAAALGAVSLIASAAIILAVYYFPFPQKGSAISFASLFGSRATSLDDSAANSRWALLPKLWQADMRHPLLGSGFGTTVTYTTSDPRLLADNPTGEYTTFAFEWGYHDLWLKLGLLGIAVYAWLLWAMAKPAAWAVRRSRALYKHPDLTLDGGQKEKAVIAAGSVLVLLALLATNVFSPYLNHPLGIGLLMLIASYGAVGAFEESSTAPTTSR